MKKDRPLCQEDLPTIRLTWGMLTPGANVVRIKLGEVERLVGVIRYRPGFAQFVCPECRRNTWTLRLYKGRMMCWSCVGLPYAGERDLKFFAERLRRQIKNPHYEYRRRRLKIDQERLRKVELAIRAKALKEWAGSSRNPASD